MLQKIHWRIQCLAQSKQHTMESGIIQMNIINAKLLSSIAFGCMDLIQKRQPINYSFALVLRARNNGQSTDNVRTDCGFDRSNFRLASHVDRSKFSSF
mgnify:CR=1 FL=1